MTDPKCGSGWRFGFPSIVTGENAQMGPAKAPLVFVTTLLLTIDSCLHFLGISVRLSSSSRIWSLLASMRPLGLKNKRPGMDYTAMTFRVYPFLWFPQNHFPRFLQNSSRTFNCACHCFQHPWWRRFLRQKLDMHGWVYVWRTLG